MKKILLPATLCMFISTALEAQFVFGETIGVLQQKVAEDSTLYPRIVERFVNNDTTLTLNELSLLYYGSAFIPGYDALQEERILDAGSSLARREKYDLAIGLFDNFLGRNPACLRGLLEKGYTHWLTKDSLIAEPTYQRYYQLLQVPLKSGTGESPEKAFVLRSIQDEDLVLNELGWLIQGESLLERNGQYFNKANCIKEDNQNTTRDFYFNVDLPLKWGKERTPQKKGGN